MGVCPSEPYTGRAVWSIGLVMDVATGAHLPLHRHDF